MSPPPSDSQSVSSQATHVTVGAGDVPALALQDAATETLAQAACLIDSTDPALVGPTTPSPTGGPALAPGKATAALKILYQVTQAETLLGWCTEDFTLYATFGPLVVKHVALTHMQKLLQWIRREEASLFLTTPFCWAS
ncbi:putative vacuolar fusion protein MON1 [Paratrimastix pyriformis]|uniref:Vacuolar fusion protein MON1 n=1 Tax=Paratrimastix pyriformis TaxID=342808 RepID=A0ABQ8UUQ1_9EUKA|nr:putative vacuolar fusion protein MON1 [Paratrimastix pyriformis]